MSSIDAERAKPTVFLSYASEDREAARLLGDALPGYGLEVWFDESELGGGDVWDQKIRRQIRECDYFMAVVSAQTEARHEGYFRREWRLAVERTLDMADDHLFLVPVVIDSTPETHARVPEKFLSVQWLKLPGGRPTAALEALCHRLVSGDTAASTGARRPPARPVSSGAPTPIPVPTPIPQAREFPREEPGQRVRFWFEVASWVLWSGWGLSKRWPKWVRISIIVWIGIILTDHFNHSGHRDSSGLSSAEERKLKGIAEQFQSNGDKAGLAILATQIAHEFSDSDESGSNKVPILAIPFAAPSGDAAAQKLSDSTFAQAYGRIAISHHGQVGLTSDPLPDCALAAMLERARAKQSEFAVCGSIDTQVSAPVLNIRIASVADKSFLWSKSYPVTDANPEKIAAEVNSALPSIDDD
jgi:TolB-like protein